MHAIRFSRQRAAIIEALRARYDHPTAEMLYQQLRQEHPNLSLGTVYRNLAQLEEQGDSIRVRGAAGPDRYDGVVAAHDHLQCRVCGAVSDLHVNAGVSLEAVQADAAKQGLTVEGCQVLYTGLCKACAEKAAQ